MAYIRIYAFNVRVGEFWVGSVALIAWNLLLCCSHVDTRSMQQVYPMWQVYPPRIHPNPKQMLGPSVAPGHGFTCKLPAGSAAAFVCFLRELL